MTMCEPPFWVMLLQTLTLHFTIAKCSSGLVGQIQELLQTIEGKVREFYSHGESE